MLITYVAAKIGSLYANIGRMSLSLLFFISVILIFRLPIELSARQWLFLALSALIVIVFGDTFLFKAFQQIGARLSMLIMASAPAIAALPEVSELHIGHALVGHAVFVGLQQSVRDFQATIAHAVAAARAN